MGAATTALPLLTQPHKVKDVIDAEMTVLGYLNFSLFTPDLQLMPHYQRLAKELQQGDDMHDLDESLGDEAR